MPTEEPIIEVTVTKRSTDDPKSAKKCHVARSGSESYPKDEFRDWDVRFLNGDATLYVIDVPMGYSRMFRLDKEASAWVQQAHHGLLPDDDEGFILRLYPKDEMRGSRRKLPGPVPPAVKKARAKARLVYQHQVFKAAKGKGKQAKPAKAEKPRERWVPMPDSTAVSQ